MYKYITVRKNLWSSEHKPIQSLKKLTAERCDCFIKFSLNARF